MNSIEKEDFFMSESNESVEVATYENINSNNETNKSYIRKIYSLDIDLNVKIEAEKKILSCERRFHSVSDEVLCVIVITTYQELGLPFNFENIIHMFELNPCRSKILDLLSKATTKSTILDELSTSINMIIIKPSIYIQELLNIYVNKCGFHPSNLPDILHRIQQFCDMLEKYYPPLKQFSPRETAAAVLYKYFDDRLYDKKRSFFSKKIFSTLTPDMASKRFDNSLKIINEKINEINISNPGYLLQF